MLYSSTFLVPSFSGLAIAKSLLVSQQCADNRLLSCLHLPIVKTALLHFNMRPASGAKLLDILGKLSGILVGDIEFK
ncbi:hypothetical protein QQP08_005323 [Theobroma cacao]|nr:hypothetical protein QQP08_005323 [Theobroma cacao]